MIRLKKINKGLAHFFIASLIFSASGNASQIGTGTVQGEQDSSGQNAGTSSFPDSVAGSVPLPHYCQGNSSNVTSTWLDKPTISCCGEGTSAANAACATCQAPPAPGVAGVITGSWTPGGLNGAIIGGGGACCGTGTGDSAQNQPCPDVCTGSTFPSKSGTFNNSGGICCNTSASSDPARGLAVTNRGLGQG